MSGRGGGSGAAPRPVSAARPSAPSAHDDLGAWMVRRGVLSAQALAKARQRQAIYGGGLDTVLLELGLCDEATVTAMLGEIKGLDPAPPALLTAEVSGARALLDEVAARRLDAVPVRLAGERVELVCGPNAAPAAVHEWAARADRSARLYVAAELRMQALLGLAYGAELAPRFAGLLGKVMGAHGARRLAEAARAARPRARVHPAPRVEALGIDCRARVPDLIGAAANLCRATAPTTAAPEAVAPALRDAPRSERKAASTPHLPATTDPNDDIEEVDWLEIAEDDSTSANDKSDDDARAAEGPLGHEPAAAVRQGAEPPLSLDSAPRAAPRNVEASADLAARLHAARTAADGTRQRAALRALRFDLDDPDVAALAAELRRAAEETTGARSVSAFGALAAIADPASIPLLVRRLGDRGAVAAAAQAALVEIARQDFGSSRWRWTRWWQGARARHRVDWLLDALGHRREELRLAASLELQELFGAYFGYHFDLGRREREEAQRRLRAFWEREGRQWLLARLARENR